MYRLKNGEMPEGLKPYAWWIMIGTNDLKSDCSVDSIVAGVITVAEEILRRDERYRQYDAAHVVINSLFPRINLDEDPLWETVQEINRRLECYAKTTEGMEFFNATELFLVKGPGGSRVIDKELFISDQIHLSAQGTRLWEEAIVKMTLKLKAESS
jgi:lysophospholipase L1-like esterase